MTVVLAAVDHDPDGLLNKQTARIVPRLASFYAGIAIVLSPQTPTTTLRLLEAQHVTVRPSDAEAQGGWAAIGRKRRAAISLAYESVPAASHIHLCDFDRILHWAEFHPVELRQMVSRLCDHDFTVFGRSARAFDSHPKVQRDTEIIINHAFALASGQHWDVCAAARGLSRAAVQTIVAECPDDTIGNDCSWPLTVQRQHDLSLAYAETEGLEFETPDRCAEAIAAAGGLEAWMAQIDNDPAQWARRLQLAWIEVESAAKYSLDRVQVEDRT
jgi:hypothetical protein